MPKIYIFKFQSKIPKWNAEGTYNPEEMVLITFTRQEVQDIMSNYVGIVRSNLRLKRAFERLELIYRETEELYQRGVYSQGIPEDCRPCQHGGNPRNLAAPIAPDVESSQRLSGMVDRDRRASQCRLRICRVCGGTAVG